MRKTDPVKGFFYLFKTGVSAQAITFLTIPLILFKYDPKSFGAFTLIISISTLLGAVSSLRIERALVVEDESVVPTLAFYCLALIATSSIICSILIRFFLEFQGEVASPITVSLLGGVYCFLMGLSQVASHLAIRFDRIKLIGKSELAFAVTLFGLLLMVPPDPEGEIRLLMIYLVARGVSIAIYKHLGFRRNIEEYVVKYVPIKELKRYVHSVFTTLLSNLQFRGIYYLSGVYFGTAVTGNIALSHRVMYSPVNLIGSALRRAYFREFAQTGSDDQRIKRHVSNVLLYGTIASLVFYPVLILSMPWVVGLLPSGWEKVPDYLVILYPAASILLLLSWLDRVYDAKKKQSRALLYESVYTLTLYVLLFWQLGETGVHGFLITYVIVTVIYNVIWSLLTLRMLGVRRGVSGILGVGHFGMTIYTITLL